MSTPDILARILESKREEVAAGCRAGSESQLRALAAEADPVRGFSNAVRTRVARLEASVIAVIKRASPSKGLLRKDFDPAVHAADYASHGACCLSVLTDGPYFQGSSEDLVAARAACKLPVVRKDFIIDSWQIWESRVMGADCILLIVAALNDEGLKSLAATAREAGMDVLVEVHDRSELERALRLDVALVGINNRDLRRFETRLGTSLELVGDIPEDRIVVSESGIHTAADRARLAQAGIHAYLVGEAFMKAPEPGRALADLLA